MQPPQTRRKAKRIQASFIANCSQVNHNEVATKVFNVSTGGIGIRTNYPISVRERLAVAFHIPTTKDLVRINGEVAWRNFDRDAPGRGEPLYTAGIKFINMERPSKRLVSDYIESGGKAMHSKEPLDFIDKELGQDFSDAEDAYSAESRNEEDSFAAKLKSEVRIFHLLIGAGILALLILIAVISPRFSNVGIESKMISLEKKLQKLEGTLHRLEWVEGRLEQIELENRQLTTFMSTVEKLGTPPKRTVTHVSKERKKAIYHQVSAGETLYGISRRYGLTVEELRRINQLKSEASIQPDQRLLIRPASGS